MSRKSNVHSHENFSLTTNKYLSLSGSTKFIVQKKTATPQDDGLSTLEQRPN
jgi:hypothetical protein